MPLNEEGVKSILDKFGTVENFINKYSVEDHTPDKEKESEKVIPQEIKIVI
jgi:hypothetical protein